MCVVWCGEGPLISGTQDQIRSVSLSRYLLINLVRESPAVAGVTVAVPRVDKAVL